MSNANDDYKVGYGRPPLNTRFKKGESGNPKGRRKGRKNLKTLVVEELFRPVSVREADGRTRRIPLIQAALRNLGTRSVKETRAATIALGLLDRIEDAAGAPGAIEMHDLLAEDREILARYSLPTNPKGRNDADDA
jgi:hypothetical protein